MNGNLYNVKFLSICYRIDVKVYKIYLIFIMVYDLLILVNVEVLWDII